MPLVLFFLKIILKCNFMSVEYSNKGKGTHFICHFNFIFINLFLLYFVKISIPHGLEGGKTVSKSQEL